MEIDTLEDQGEGGGVDLGAGLPGSMMGELEGALFQSFV
jgi:hypothetical protein